MNRELKCYTARQADKKYKACCIDLNIVTRHHPTRESAKFELELQVEGYMKSVDTRTGRDKFLNPFPRRSPWSRWMQYYITENKFKISV